MKLLFIRRSLTQLKTECYVINGLFVRRQKADGPFEIQMKDLNILISLLCQFLRTESQGAASKCCFACCWMNQSTCIDLFLPADALAYSI